MLPRAALPSPALAQIAGPAAFASNLRLATELSAASTLSYRPSWQIWTSRASSIHRAAVRLAMFLLSQPGVPCSIRQRGLGLIECLAAAPRILDSAPSKVIRAGPVEHGPLTRILRRLTSRRQSRQGSRFGSCYFSHGKTSSSCRRVGDPKSRSKISESRGHLRRDSRHPHSKKFGAFVIASSVDRSTKAFRFDFEGGVMELTSVKCPTSVAGCTPFGGGYQTRRAHLFPKRQL